jgi:hypothetical protein
MDREMEMEGDGKRDGDGEDKGDGRRQKQKDLLRFTVRVHTLPYSSVLAALLTSHS